MRKITKRINHLKEETWILQNNFERINQSDSEYGCVYMSDWHRREIGIAKSVVQKMLMAQNFAANVEVR